MVPIPDGTILLTPRKITLLPGAGRGGLGLRRKSSAFGSATPGCSLRQVLYPTMPLALSPFTALKFLDSFQREGAKDAINIQQR